MASSASSPSKPVDDELKLDELVSELQALKKLYGLLQNNSPKPARPDQPTAHALDEKSRHLLKKLLDGATQQALQSQAKAISCTPETPKSQAEPNSNPFHNDLRKEVRETQKNQECHSAAPPADSPEAAISAPVAQLEIPPNPCPIHEPSRLNRRRSKDATVHRCRANDSARLDRLIMSRPSESGSRRKSSQPSKNGSCRVQSIRSGSSERPPSSEKGGELLPLVPVQKRARVEPVDLPSLASSRTNKPDQIDRELTHQKKRTNRKETGAEPNSIGSMQRMRSSKYQNCPSIVLVGNEMAQIVQKNNQLAETKTRVTSNKHQEPARLNRSKANRFSSSSRESTPSISDSSRSIPSTQLKLNRIKTKKKLAPPPPPPPTLSNIKVQRSPSLAKSLIVQKNDQLRETKSRASKPTKPARPTRSRAGRYSSSSTGSTRANSVSNRSTRPDMLTPRKQSRVQTRRRRRRASSPPSSKPPISYRAIVPRWQPPPSRPAKTRVEPKQEEEEEQGRFKKLTNKLAIIFHHHHHHHHHLHAKEGDEGGGGGQKDHERSLWKHLKGALHAKKGSGEEKGKLHRHNLRVMMERFLRHLWWMKQRRRKKVVRRRITKKVKLWEWFRRKGGMVVGGRRRVMLRLGFNGSRRRAAGGKG